MHKSKLARESFLRQLTNEEMFHRLKKDEGVLAVDTLMRESEDAMDDRRRTRTKRLKELRETSRKDWAEAKDIAV